MTDFDIFYHIWDFIKAKNTVLGYKKGSKNDSGLWKFSNISSEVSNALSNVFICDLELYLCVIEI